MPYHADSDPDPRLGHIIQSSKYMLKFKPTGLANSIASVITALITDPSDDHSTEHSFRQCNHSVAFISCLHCQCSTWVVMR